MKFLFALALLTGACFFTASASQSPLKTGNPCFVENKGQWPEPVLFQARLNGLDAWITRTGVVYDFYRLAEAPENLETAGLARSPFSHRNKNRIGQVVRVSLTGASPSLRASGSGKQPGCHNYFIGDRRSWASGVRLYEEAWVNGLYPGIGLRYYFEEGKLRYDYVLDPNADAAQIAMALEGTDGAPFVNAAGELEFATRFGAVRQARLFAYQAAGAQRKPVDCRFTQDLQGRFHFAVGDYDKRLPLVIDPLVYSTFLGGTGRDDLSGLATDAAGNAYVAGTTLSSDFPTTAGSYDRTFNGGTGDVFVTKLSASGSSLIYSTFVGGSGADYAYTLDIDAAGNAYVAGTTGSSDFPRTAGSYSGFNASGYYDAFVTKLDPSGSALAYSTLLGGSNLEVAFALDVDASGSAYVAGYTRSNDFPTTSNAFDRTYNGGYSDVFLTRLNAAGSAVIYSTLYGGSGEDQANGLSVDASGRAYISFYTTSTDVPIPFNGLRRTFAGGNSDGFLAAFDAGSALVFATYLGGSDEDVATSLEADGSGNVYVAGYTRSADFPTTPGAYDRTFGGRYDVFVNKINVNSATLLYSTYLGGGGGDSPGKISLDASGNVWIAGTTDSSDFPVTPGSYNTMYAGSADTFVAQLDTAGSTLRYASFLGGQRYDAASSISVNAAGNIYVAGNTGSYDFPVTPGAYGRTANTLGNAFITKLSPGPLGVADTRAQARTWKVWPNPSGGSFTIEAQAPSDFELLDLTGRKVADYSVTAAPLRVHTALGSGVYLLRERRTGSTQRIVIE